MSVPEAGGGEPGVIRVLVVDDTLVQRRLVTSVLGAEPRIDVVGAAHDGVEGLASILSLRPDVVVLDIEMPNLDGLGVLRELRARSVRVPIIMYSTLTERGANVTFDALSLGAADYALKPHGAENRDAALAQVRSELVPKVVALGSPARKPVTRPTRTHLTTIADLSRRPTVSIRPKELTRPASPKSLAQRPAAPKAATRHDASLSRPASRVRGQFPRVGALVVASSTGGPEALARVLPGLPASLPVPVLVVQHMPPMFTRMMAERLDRICPLRVLEAEDGAEVLPGTIWIAQGGRHLEVRTDGAGVRLHLSDAPAEQSVRPAADVLFRSAAKVWGATLLAAVLTGMGADGRAGSDVIVRAGGHVLAQDAESSVVYGMPAAVAEAGLADAVLPLDGIAGEIVQRTSIRQLSGGIS